MANWITDEVVTPPETKANKPGTVLPGVTTFYYTAADANADSQRDVDTRDYIRGREVDVKFYGAVGDGITDDRAALQKAIDAAGVNGTVVFSKTTTGLFNVSGPLKFLTGQTWVGSGGTDVLGAGTEIRLTATATSVAEPSVPATTTYYFNVQGIYFNAQGFGDCGLSLYNTSYANVEACAANSTKASGCGLLLDSDTSLQCYFNVISGGRWFASGSGGAAIRFMRGANANMVLGGKCGSSFRGMEFLTLSSGNVVVGTDFENNSDRHIYVNAPSNVFQGLHMESSPIGYDITTLGTSTARFGTSYASTVTTQVQDASKTGSVVDTRTDASSTKGDLRFGAAKLLSNYLSTATNVDFDPDLATGTAAARLRFFLSTTTSGERAIKIYKGDGTSTLSINLDASTGQIQGGDLLQENTDVPGVYRKTVRRAAAPTTGTWSQGDIVFATLPTAGGFVGWVCTTAGTPGTWKTFGAITP